jgi:hypothetical protein
MFKKIGLSTGMILAALAFIQPTPAAAADRDDYGHGRNAYVAQRGYVAQHSYGAREQYGRVQYNNEEQRERRVPEVRVQQRYQRSSYTQYCR